jgi:hypothetical protein
MLLINANTFFTYIVIKNSTTGITSAATQIS